MSVIQSPASTPTARRLFDVLASPAFLLVAILFFFPLFDISCGGNGGPTMAVKYHGLSLTAGVTPYSEGLGIAEKEKLKQDLQKPWMPFSAGDASADAFWKLLKSYDWLFGLVPLLSLGLVPRIFRASGREMRTREQINFVVTSLIIVGLMGYYAIVGFIIERQSYDDLHRDAAKGNPSIPIEIGKTNWFWLMLVVSLIALCLLFMRRRSPYLLFAQNGIRLTATPTTTVAA